MERIQLLDKISDYLAVLSTKIHIENSNNEYNINIHAENIMLKILEKTYDCKLFNANFSNKNYPAIDLIDNQKKIGFQITSTPSNNKIISTLEKAIKYYQESEIKELKIFILSRKLQSKIYLRSAQKYADILDGKIIFDAETDIIDSSSLYEELNKQNDLNKLHEISEILEKEFGRLPIINKSRYSVYLHFSEEDIELAEDVVKRLIESGTSVYSNSNILLENLKDTLYTALFTNIEGQVIPNHVHYVASLVTASYLANEIINIEGFKNAGKIVFPYIVDLPSEKIVEFGSTQPPLFFQKNNAVKIANNCVERIIGYEDGNEIDNDIMSILRNFRPNDKFVKLHEETIKKKGVGFELYAQITGSSKIVEYFLYLKAQGERFNVKLNHSLVRSFIKDAKYPFTVLAPKANHLKNPNNRYSSIKNSYRESEVYFIDEFAWQKCNTISFRDNVDGDFLNIDNFVIPFMSKLNIDGENEGIIQSEEILNWFNLKNEPILVFAGIGGIGKTTLARKYADYFQNKNSSVGVLFIESENIIRKLQQFDGDEQAFDLYNFYLASISTDQYSNEKLTREMFQFHFDNGRILVIIDGLDEVISRVSQFDIGEFVESIKQNNIKNGFGKVILTCRKYFWIQEKSTRSNILSVEINPFDKKKAKLFFEARNNLVGYSNKCMDLSDSLSLRNENTQEYIPFVLDVVSTIVESQIEDILDLETSFNNQQIEHPYLRASETMDYVIFHICNREIIRTKQIPVIAQIDFFINLCVFENGIIKEDKLSDSFNNLDILSSENQRKAMLAHPLLYTKDKKVVFRYDFLDQYFKSLYLSKFFNFEVEEKINKQVINILAECRYNSGIALELTSRKELNWCENTSLKISAIIDDIKKYKDDTLKKSSQINATGGLVALSLTLMHKKNGNSIRNNTDLIKKMFEYSPNKLEGLVLMNIIDNTGSGIRFNFEGMHIENGICESYDDFWKCKFNEETVFRKCSFNNIAAKIPEHFSAIKSNFIDPMEFDDSLDKIFKMEEGKESKKETKISDSLQQFLKSFYSNGQFKIRDYDFAMKKAYQNMNYKPASFSKFVHILSGHIIVEHPNGQSRKSFQIQKEAKQSVMKFCQEGSKRPILVKTINSLLN